MTSQGNQRRNITLARDPQAPINRLINSKGQDNAAETLDGSLTRYMTTIRRSMPDFAVPEWCLIFDALKPPWSATEAHTANLPHEIGDAISIDHLDQKWPVDGAKLKSRIDRLNFPARMAIGEMAEAFWASLSQGSYAEIIDELLQIFGEPHRPAAVGRSNRMDTERMGAPQEALPPQNHQTEETRAPKQERESQEAHLPLLTGDAEEKYANRQPAAA